MPSQPHDIRDVVSNRFSLAMPVLIVGAVLVLVAPLPAMVMDVLLAANLTISLIVLLTSIHVRNPLEFSTFPSILLGTALVRLVLNVASTRLILTQGAIAGSNAAGDVIQAFGQFVAGGNPAVGMTLFVIMVAIQFLVITSGSTRISEVGARFALDGMPGRQAAIDSDLAAGLISREEAIHRRQTLSRQADFYGAMDGANKYVRGDAVAGLLITGVNISVGLLLGVLQHGMSVTEAFRVFTTLTIGDGLVAQLPAFLIALASGLIVTRTSVDSDLSRDTVTQIFQHSRVLYITAAALSVLAFTGLPLIPMLTFAVGCAGLGWLIDETPIASKPSHLGNHRPAPPQGVQVSTAAPVAADPKTQLHVEPLQLDLGVGLVRLADSEAGGDLLVRVTQLRSKVAEQLGFILPKVRIQDNLHLEPFQYQIRLREACVARGVIDPDAMLAVETIDSLGALEGEQVRDPLSDRHAWWVTGEEVDRARSLGYQLLEPQQVVTNHLAAVVHRHSEELLTRQQVHALVEHLQQRAPQLVSEVLPLVPVAKIHRVLTLLLREQVPIRDLESIIEALSDHAEATRDVNELVERVRRSLARTICQQYRTADRKLVALSLSRDLDDELSALLRISAADPLSAWPSRQRQLALDAISIAATLMRERGLHPVIVCPNELRPLVRQLTQYTLPHLAVLSQAEISRDTELVIVGRVETTTQDVVGVGT